jgi:hypothetical protein
MDNFGFGNWNNDDSYDMSPNKDNYSRKAGAKKGGKNDSESFDFDISTDFVASPVQRSAKDRRAAVSEASSSRFGGISRRSSIEDRTKEILERNKNSGKGQEQEEDHTRLQSYEDTFAELMDGLDVNKYKDEDSPRNAPTDREAHTPGNSRNQSGVSGVSGVSGAGVHSFSRLDSSLESPTGGDSLEISATDLEVRGYVWVGQQGRWLPC